MHLKKLGLTDNLRKTEKEYKNLKKQEINDIFIKANWIKLDCNMIWLMETLEI